MRRYQWSYWTDAQAAYRRAGGRRRYNAMRQRRAEERRAMMERAIAGAWVAAFFGFRGFAPALGHAFGVHRSTAWRDLQRILGLGPSVNFTRQGEVLYTVDRACQGGPVVGVYDAQGWPIRGPERKRIVKSVPRYLRRRR